MKDWYDKGIGSEHLKQQCAKSALENPVPNVLCIGCEYKKRPKRNKKRIKAAILTMDLMGGDAMYEVISEKDYLHIISDEFTPTKKWNDLQKGEIDVLDPDKYQKKVLDYLYDQEKEKSNDKVLEEWYTQTYCPEDIDLSKYVIVGMLTLPGG
jgi:hypothetical protein